MSDKGMTERQALGRMGEDAAARLETLKAENAVLSVVSGTGAK